MKMNAPKPNNPPVDVIDKWNCKLEELIVNNRDFINIKNFLIKHNWSLESCKNVLFSISNVKMNYNNKDIILF